ncbi:hypothetical protein GGH19_004343 [Coemansia sp. RSA 1807]|nr:hypothetical protein LPJ58_004788 [Coemansia sp. RSA 1591]KAJ2166201.1 hypothetical protein GGH15_002894 [Coemansia sp. RSA 562]KAJ2194221.1 hypothetical protein IW144_004066 [Coemansia sp. RSA 522]KAJ2223000.1 hypothetical protein EV180_004139 [Coemansia sp. RSA 518]KAJ2272950.1 hypothetical protein EV176_003487 [Coemansia sp. RSA 451]KAJ2273840.1 hypothetical protein GGH14_004273 [Coemansia sp. RSA 370]KAJ2274136.1 hypothetical protein J3F81_002361 [Coemansia sp. RSA 371]KAJ2289904.1 hy
MKSKALSIFAVLATTFAVLGTSGASAHPVADQRQAVFSEHKTPEMATPYTFDTHAQGPPELSDILGREKRGSIAMDGILRSEALVRAISGDSADFAAGLTLLLPTNQAFQQLDEIPEDVEKVLERHFIPQKVTAEQMKEGVTVGAYEGTVLRFTESDGRVFVQADQRSPVEVMGAGTRAGSGTYFLVDQLFV